MGKMYRPDPAPPRENCVKGEAKTFDPCPAFHKEFKNPKFKFVSWDMKPGDCLVHHPLTIHGAGKNSSNTKSRIALSKRYLGGDATWASPRTTFTVPGTEKIPKIKIGQFPANNDVFPIAWQHVQVAKITSAKELKNKTPTTNPIEIPILQYFDEIPSAAPNR
tara:strand:+ start:1402 stop:1890 length:489 start_codon:yes stop_codon:yes gene_type:complete